MWRWITRLCGPGAEEGRALAGPAVASDVNPVLEMDTVSSLAREHKVQTLEQIRRCELQALQLAEDGGASPDLHIALQTIASLEATVAECDAIIATSGKFQVSLLSASNGKVVQQLLMRIDRASERLLPESNKADLMDDLMKKIRSNIDTHDDVHGERDEALKKGGIDDIGREIDPEELGDAIARLKAKHAAAQTGEALARAPSAPSAPPGTVREKPEKDRRRSKRSADSTTPPSAESVRKDLLNIV